MIDKFKYIIQAKRENDFVEAFKNLIGYRKNTLLDHQNNEQC